MDKKQAEEEARQKAKDAQAAAGKNSGMSGRDLVRFTLLCSVSNMLTAPDVTVPIQPGVVRGRGRGGRGRMGLGEVPPAEGGRGPSRGGGSDSGTLPWRLGWCVAEHQNTSNTLACTLQSVRRSKSHFRSHAREVRCTQHRNSLGITTLYESQERKHITNFPSSLTHDQ